MFFILHSTMFEYIVSCYITSNWVYLQIYSVRILVYYMYNLCSPIYFRLLLDCKVVYSAIAGKLIYMQIHKGYSKEIQSPKKLLQILDGIDDSGSKVIKIRAHSRNLEIWGSESVWTSISFLQNRCSLLQFGNGICTTLAIWRYRYQNIRWHLSKMLDHWTLWSGW